jgi:hypothetical protein
MSSSGQQLARRLTGGGSGGGSGKPINWRFLLLTCLLSLATISGLLFFNPGGIVPRGLLPAPPKKKKGAAAGESAAGGEAEEGEGKGEQGGKMGGGAGLQQAEVPVEKGEDEREYESLGAKVSVT